LLVLFSLTALTSAFLLFWVEPLFAKMVLPLLGGSPAVWNTCLMYFQAMLLLGYLYAHLSSRYLDARKQARVHVGLLALALVSLPVAIPGGWTPPPSGNVIPWLLKLLTLALGAPFVVLAATAPLVQRWLSGTEHPAAKNPYMLYAASNAGSLLGLLAFPVLLEPNLSLGDQAKLWSAGYAIAVVLTTACAWLLWRKSPRRKKPATPAASANDDSSRRPANRERARWLALAFVPSSLLLGVTTYLSTDVASMPLLWVVPLALYLITFIIVFARRSRRQNLPAAIVHAVLVTLLVLLVFWDRHIGLRWEYVLHLGVFAATALVLHGELAASRPATEHLTEFYLWLALGGALGGAFNALIAPLLFKSIAEYQLVLVLACFLRPSWRVRAPDFIEGIPWVTSAAIPALLLGVIAANGGGDHHILGIPAKMIASLIAAGIVLSLSTNALRFGVSVASLALVGAFLAHRSERILFADRSFFGAYRVQRLSGSANFLIHGTTIHGAQFPDSARRRTPVTYYHPRGPVGQLFSALQGRLPDRRIGVVGLGAGSLLCYSKPGEEWTFFEIDPLVEGIARNRKYFTFLHDCAVQPKVVIGDARLTLSRQPDARFGLLVVDAFSSDAIPVHLLTREALALYRRVLDQRGILFIHISNQHLNLQPVVAALAADAGLVALMEDYDASATEEARELDYSCDWVALARHKEDLGALAGDPRWHPLATGSGSEPWTDDYSNVFSVIRW
jgi:cytochrome c-type biogenesis protein CcmH/NrfF